MPTYEYECKKCGHVFEEFQSMTAEPLTDCPLESCDGQVQRLLSGGAGFLFKGSGFYITDYRSDSYKNAAKAESGSGSGSGSEKKSSGGKSDTGSSSSGASSKSTNSSKSKD